MRSLLSIPTKLALVSFIILIILSPHQPLSKWIFLFNEIFEGKMNDTLDSSMKNPDHHSSPSGLFSPSNETLESPNLNNNASNSNNQQSAGIMTALGGASPCFSLGLGSSSSNEKEDTAPNTEEETNQSALVNASILSNNVTMRNSTRISRREDAESDESSDFSLMMEPEQHSAAEKESKTPSMSTAKEMECKLPEQVMTTNNNLSRGFLSPLSPDVLDRSDGMERAVAAPIVNEAIAGLSPIIATRESDACIMQVASPRDVHVGSSSDGETLTPLAEKTLHNSLASQRSVPPQSSSKEQETLKEGEIRLEAGNGDVVVDESGNKSVESKSTNDDAKVPASPPSESRSHGSYEQSTLSPDDESVPRIFEKRSFVQEQSNGDDAASLEDAAASEDKENECMMRSSIPSATVGASLVDEASLSIPVQEEVDVNKSSKVAPTTAFVAGKQSSLTTVETSGSEADNGGHEEEEEEEVAEDLTEIVTVDIESNENDSALANSVTQPSNELLSGNEMTAEDKFIEDSIHSLLSTTLDERMHETELSMTSTGSYQVETSTVDSPLSAATSNAEEGARKETSTPVYRDLTSAKKNIDVSSMAFIERLRSAANRRKRRVLKSRESLAAKEKEHLLSIASANERRLRMAPKPPPPTTDTLPVDPSSSVEPYKPFRARPAPKTTGHLGSGGQVGVPKVPKKPTTTPFSPLLGARRPKAKPSSSRETEPRQSASQSNTSRRHSMPFKARPAPSTTGIKGHGGQVGVPKVPSRPSTVPVSPLLGSRRNSLPTASKPKTQSGVMSSTPSFVHESKLKRESTKFKKPFAGILSGSEVSKAKESARLERLQEEADAERKAREFRARPMPKFGSQNTPTSSKAEASPVLLGLDILNHDAPSIDTSTTGRENVEPQIATPRNQPTKSLAFVPHSTARAKKRASFDELRALHERERQDEQETLRRSMIKQQRAELTKFSRENLL